MLKPDIQTLARIGGTMNFEDYNRAYDLIKKMARAADQDGRPGVRDELDTALAHLSNAWSMTQAG